MPTEKPRLTFALSEELREQINEYQFTHRVKNQSQAIISLLNMGIDAINQEQTDVEPSSDILYVSRPSGNRNTDELRKRLHDSIDRMNDDDLKLLAALTDRMNL